MYELTPPVDPPQPGAEGADAQLAPPAEFSELERESLRQATHPAATIVTGHKRGTGAKSWGLTPALEALVIWSTDPRWWAWIGGGQRSKLQVSRPMQPPLPLPTAVIGNRPIIPPPVIRGEDEIEFLPKALWVRMLAWLRGKGRFHVISTLAHAVAIILLGLLAGHFQASARNYGPVFDSTLSEGLPKNDIVRFNLNNSPVETSVLDTAALEQFEPEPVGQLEQINDNSAVFEEKGGGKVADPKDNLGGLGGFEVKSIGAGPAVSGPGGVGMGVGTGEHAGSGGAGSGFGGRGAGMREAMAGAFGGTRQTERAVAGALNWIARHQNPDGSWSLDQFNKRCKDKTCTGSGEIKSDAAATAMALLPFLAAGQTQESKGPYQKTIRGGLHWLVNHQLSDGSLAGVGNYTLMYTHGLATIAVCEAYGLTKDSRLGVAAQSAIQFIESSQNTAGGGWRYEPGQAGDTSVTGWQVMALKSAQMAGLKVTPEALAGAKKFLLSVASGSAGNEFSYLKGDEATLTMSAVGLLCSQYLGASRQDAIMLKGMNYLAHNHPTSEQRDCYYWYYGTQVMHNLPGPQWDTWNRQLRRLLVKSQITEGCATGSWDPDKPTPDLWGHRGGRLMQTSLSALSLEVYYRYLPLYRLDGAPGGPSSHAPDAEGATNAKQATSE